METKMEALELNGMIKTTYLVPNVFQATIETILDEQQATATFSAPLSQENVQRLLEVAGKPCWEQLSCSPIRLRITKREQGFKLEAIGHFILDHWFEVPEIAE